MKRMLAAMLCLSPALAAAQDEGPIADPNAPDPNLPPDLEKNPPAYRYEKRDYPKELVRRPLTLAAEQVELGLDVPFVAGDGHPTMTQVLQAAYGVTVDLELGFTYSVGLERLSARTGEDGFEPGKAFSLDAEYTILPGWLAAQLRVAFYADPDVFGLGLILGVPFHIPLGDQFLIFGGADLVSIKLTGFAPNPARPDMNEGNVGLIAREIGTSSGSIDLSAGVAYQAQPNLALWGTIGLGWPNFDTNDQPFALFVGLSYSPRRFWDVGARIGFLALDEPAASFSIGAFTAVRL